MTTRKATRKLRALKPPPTTLIPVGADEKPIELKPDPVADAIAGVEQKEQAAKAAEPDTLINQTILPDGKGVLRMIVPIAFDADQFETAVGMLIQLRFEAERRKAEKAPKLVVPSHDLVGPDGKKLS
jgi:hypothetical protein